jgi:lipopolysaccharide export system permease protein
MRIDLYILREWGKVFLLTLCVIIGLILLNDIQDNLQDLVGYGASQGAILQYYLVKFPSLLPVALPISFLLSLLFSLGSLHRNHEITAMRAAGLTLLRIARSLWLVAVILSCLLFYLNARWVPWSVETARALWNDAAFSKALETEAPEEVGLIHNLTFFNRKDGRLWFLNRFNEFNYRAYGLTLSELDSSGEETKRIVANEAYFDDLSGHWILLQGRETWFGPDGEGPVRSLAFERKVATDAREEPDLMKALEKRPGDLSLRELKFVVDYLRPADDPRLASYAVTFYDRFFNPLSCLIVLGLAIPFSVSGMRTNPFVGVSKAMGFFVLYYLVVNIGQIAGGNGFPPIWAALLPNLVALLLITHYFIRLQRPS